MTRVLAVPAKSTRSAAAQMHNEKKMTGSHIICGTLLRAGKVRGLGAKREPARKCRKEKRMGIFFTSDLHLGHENAIKHTNRPFANVTEMNCRLIGNINEVVGVNDELWILGDFSYRINKEEARLLRKQIKCKHVHLVYGNHDKNYEETDVFQSTQYYKELKTEYGKVILFHYPIADWNAKHYGSIHLHGHIHSTGEYNRSNLTRKADELFSEGHSAKDGTLFYRIYDVGVDANDYKPVSLEHIVELMGENKQ